MTDRMFHDVVVLGAGVSGIYQIKRLVDLDVDAIVLEAEDDLGGTMRLGAYPAQLAEGSKVREIYGTDLVYERHRHRYEINVAYREDIEAAGLKFAGMSPDGRLPEIVELEDHPWYIGVQFHPELKSRPMAPHPLFKSFIAAALQHSRLV